MKEINKKIDVRRKTVPTIFQVRSSFASFLRSTFSSFSAFSLVDDGFSFFAGFSSFTGFSSVLGLVDFLSLLAMGTKIKDRGVKYRVVAGFRKI